MFTVRTRLPALRPFTRRRPRTARGRARAAVGFGVAAALAAHVWLGVAVETTRPQWRDPEFFHRQQRADKVARWEVSQGHARPVVIVLGSSRSQMGLSPEHLGLGTGPTDPIVFNCSQSGCRPVGLRLNAARLLAARPTPDFLLVEVLPALVGDGEPPEAWLPASRLGAADVDRLRPYFADPARVWREWAHDRVVSWSSLRHTLQPHWFGPDLVPQPRRDDFLWSEMRFFGWSPYYPGAWTDADRLPRVEANRRGYAPRLADWRAHPVPDRAYRDLLTDCRERNIPVALYLMPESPAFRS